MPRHKFERGQEVTFNDNRTGKVEEVSKLTGTAWIRDEKGYLRTVHDSGRSAEGNHAHHIKDDHD
jgi:hypothetical protein